MELFKHIMTAMIVGALLAAVWLGLYALIWLATSVSALLAITVIMFIAGTLFYLLEVPYV